MYKLPLALLVVLISISSWSQDLTQTIRGTLVDKESFQPIIGAKVIVATTDPVLGGISDIDGKFRIENVPVGKHNLIITSIGYEVFQNSNLEVGGKEVILNIEMVESVNMMNKVEVTAQEKGEVINKMATVSARSFSVEESNRYAGTLNDVARMAQRYAGVQGADDSRNDIIVRGNSPTGILYRMDGIDIPNPNHFARFGTTGGPISMINNNVLSNSDFLTGAFPAEYGNALSGVFDLKMRAGNNEKHEFMFQMGFNGAEVMAEGPISKKKGSSYMLSYRYSTLKLFQLMGINFGSSALPNYQDASFKFNFPSKGGLTTVFGIGGVSSIAILAENADSTDLYALDYSNTIFQSRMGVVGVTHKQRVGKKSYIRASVGLHSALNYILNDTVDFNFENPFTNFVSNSVITKGTADVFYNRKINSKHTFKLGFHGDMYFMRLNDSLYLSAFDQFISLRNFNGNTFVWQPYAQYQWRPNTKLIFNAGLHAQGLMLNGEAMLEPRFGAAWNMTKKDRLSFGYGLHSQLQPLEMYFQQTTIDGIEYETNRDVGFSKSHHFVLGYQHNFAFGIQTKLEAYYQHLYDIPVESMASSFSMINFGSEFNTGVPDSLVNEGSGRNYGVELTLEKYLNRGFYFLMTGSLYESYYTTKEDVEYNSAFNGNFTSNALMGYELRFKKGKKVQPSMTFDINFTCNGGRRYTPILLEESQAAGTEIRDMTQINTARFPAYLRGDFKIGFKLVGKKFTQQWSVDIQNFTNRQNIFLQEYDESSESIQTTYQTGFLPVVQYRLYFTP